MKNIAIINVYGFKNIGDGAILESAIRIINKAIPKNRIDVHTSTYLFEKINSLPSIRTYINPYGSVIQSKKNPISDYKKIVRFIHVLIVSLGYSLLGKFFPRFLPTDGNFSYIKSLKEADVVLGIGGGYFRTKNKYKDYFGLSLILLPIFIAHLYKKRILYLPVSFGNFASGLQKRIAFYFLNSDKIIFRDQISLQELTRLRKQSVEEELIPDLALFDVHKILLKKGGYIVLTARQWLRKDKQNQFEQELAKFVVYVWKRYKLKTIFIPMAWNESEDDDTEVGLRIKHIINNTAIFEIKQARTPFVVKELLSGAYVSICTRMHSAILATIVKTPFITIAYEHKTLGFLKHFGLEEWNIDIDNFNFLLLKEKYDALAEDKYKDFQIRLEHAHREVLRKETKLVELIRDFESVVL